VEFKLAEQELSIPRGWVVVYVEEAPLDEVSAHDSAAMSPRTELFLKVASFEEYDYSADRYVVAVIAEDDAVVQSIRVNRS
jgi:hypothetical protein